MGKIKDFGRPQQEIIVDGKLYKRHMPFSDTRIEEEEEKYLRNFNVKVVKGTFQEEPTNWIYLNYGKREAYDHFSSNIKGIHERLKEYLEYKDLLKKTKESSEVVTLPDGRKWTNTSKEYPYDMTDLRSGMREEKEVVSDLVKNNLSYGTDSQLATQEWKDALEQVTKAFPRYLKKFEPKE